MKICIISDSFVNDVVCKIREAQVCSNCIHKIKYHGINKYYMKQQDERYISEIDINNLQSYSLIGTKHKYSLC